MDSRVIDSVVESLVAGELDAENFIRVIEQGIEAQEASLHRNGSGTQAAAVCTAAVEGQ